MSSRSVSNKALIVMALVNESPGTSLGINSF